MADDPLDNPFGPESMIWRICRHRVTLLCGPAAAIMQVAHPRIGLGVYVHSQFQESPLGRLHRTLDAVYAIVFGSYEDGCDAAGRVAQIHRDVRGDARSRDVPGSAQYSAFEPDLLRWVIATMIVSAIDGYERCVGPLTREQLERFYGDMRKLGTYFALPVRFGPQDWDDFLRYWDAQLANPMLGRHEISREVARAVALPKHPFWLRFAALPIQFIYSEILPPAIGQRLGFRSTRLKRLALALATTLLRLISRCGPDIVRFVPHYNQAIRQRRDHAKVAAIQSGRSAPCAE
jgi:uncharacterized protein (DUF2236 family)